jgi:general secretion pathway protein K
MRRTTSAPGRAPGRVPDAGVVLINVLVILALTSAVLLVMVRASDLSIARSQVFSDAEQGLAFLQGGEASAMAALRRDMLEAPEADHLREAWALVAQNTTEIEGGTFALEISDAQARFNLNAISGSGVVGPQILSRLVARLDLPEDTAPRILARLAQRRPLLRLDQLIPEAGLAPETLASLREGITLLPGRQGINLNTAPPDLIFALTDNPVQARILLAIRERKGYLTTGDFVAANVILPAGTGFTSQYFEVTTRVTLGTSTQSLQSLLRRYQNDAGQADVAVIARSSR